MKESAVGLPEGVHIWVPKIPSLVNFGKLWNRGFWFNLWQLGIFCGNLVHFVEIWYILWKFGTFCGNLDILWKFPILLFPILVRYTFKNLATLINSLIKHRPKTITPGTRFCRVREHGMRGRGADEPASPHRRHQGGDEACDAARGDRQGRVRPGIDFTKLRSSRKLLGFTIFILIFWTKSH
jgi:hypothetical protein